MTAGYAAVAVVLLFGCLVLLCHPLLRFLKVSEVPAALLTACTGRLNRRRLLFILRSRRESYLEDIEGVPPWHVLAWQDLSARWEKIVRRLGFAWEHGPLVTPPPEKKLAARRCPCPDREHVARALQVSAGSVSARGIGPRPAGFTVGRGDWRDGLSVSRHPWARLEANWKDIGPGGRRG